MTATFIIAALCFDHRRHRAAELHVEASREASDPKHRVQAGTAGSAGGKA